MKNKEIKIKAIKKQYYLKKALNNLILNLIKKKKLIKRLTIAIKKFKNLLIKKK